MRRWAFVLMFLAVAAVWAQTAVYVSDVTSDLPNSNSSGWPDYWADKGQTHHVEVTFTIFHDPYPPMGDTLKLYHLDCGGNPVLISTLNVTGYSAGDYTWTETVTEPVCPSDTFVDSIWVEHVGVSFYGYGDRDIIVMVEDSAKINVDSVFAVTAVTKTPQKQFTMGQNFYLRVCLTNTGIAPIQDVIISLDTTMLTDVECSFVSNHTFVDVDVNGGETRCFDVPIIADPDHHGVVGDDERFIVSVTGREKNLGGALVGSVSYSDDDDTIGVVMEPVLEVIRIDTSYFSRFTGDGYPWLSSVNGGGYDFYVRSLPGDYAVVDSLNEVNYYFDVELIYGDEVVPGIDMTYYDVMDTTFMFVDTIAPGDIVVYSVDIDWDGITPTIEDSTGVHFVARFHNATRDDEEYAATSPLDTVITFPPTLVDVTPPYNLLPVIPSATNPSWPTNDTVFVSAQDYFDGHYSVDLVFVAFLDANGNYWNGTAWTSAPFWFNMLWTGDSLWFSHIPEPTPQFTSIGIWAQDSAGNDDFEIYAFGLAIDTMFSSLPNVDTTDPIIDYHADKNQLHTVTVRVYSLHDVVAGRDTLFLYQRDCVGNIINVWQYVLPAVSAGDTLDITYDLTEPNCAADVMIDSIRAELRGPDISLAYSHDDIVVSVEEPGQLVVDDVIAVADTVLPPHYNEPFFTMGQNFWLAVIVHNEGAGFIQDINIDLASSSVYGCESYFAPTTSFDIALDGGTVDTLFIPIVGDTIEHGGMGTDDEIFTVTASATDVNTLGPCEVNYTDDDDSIGIVMPPSLHLYMVDGYGSMPTGLVNDWGGGIYWLKFYGTSHLRFYVYSDTGDYAIADSLVAYNPLAALYGDSGWVEGVEITLNNIYAADFMSYVSVIAPGDTVVYDIVVGDNGIPTKYEGFVSGKFHTAFHDFNRADAPYASTSPFDTTFEPSSYILGIDVTAPTVAYVNPYSTGDPWPAGDTVFVVASDAVSGVRLVDLEIRNASGDYWDGTTWDWLPYDFTFTHYSGDTFFCVIPEPTGVSSYTMYLAAVDSAGNVSNEEPLPRGAVAYLHIYDVTTDLPSVMVPGERWQADWYQGHTVTVHIYNEYSQELHNVVLGLRSSDPHTIISGSPHMGMVNIPTIAPGEHQFINFTVYEPGYDIIDDTLEAFLVSADPTADGRVVGEHYTDDDIYVNVEKPARLYVYQVWSDAPTQVEDTAYVTYDVGGDSDNPQVFTVFIKVCYTGEDTIEYARVNLIEGPVADYLTPLGPTVFDVYQHNFTEHIVDDALGDLYCYTVSTQYMADSNVCADRAAEVMFFADFDSVDFDNWAPGASNPGYTQIEGVDNATYAAVLEPPRVDIVNAEVSGGYYNGGVLWLNGGNSITFTVELYSLLSSCDDFDRATARFAGERTPLVGLDTLGYPVVGIDGMMTPVGLDDTLFPGAYDTISYTITWDGMTDVNTIIPTFVDTIWFRNNYWDVYPLPWLLVGYDTLGNPIYIQPEIDTLTNYIPYIIGVDVVAPVVNIISPTDPMYSEWTWEDTLLITATDNFSGVDDSTVEVAIVDPAGNYWNGTNWQTDEIWLSAVNFGGGYYGVPMPSPADLINDGYYRLYAKCSDVAGNESAVSVAQIIYDSTSPMTSIIVPDDGDSVAYYHCNFDTIWVVAWDTVVVTDPTQVAGVHQVYIAIEDTFIHRWWDGALGTWVTSMAAIYNPMTHGSGDMWYYTGIVPPEDYYGYHIYTYADDNVGNFVSPTDSAMAVNDCYPPVVFLTDSTYTNLVHDMVFSSDTLFSNYWDSVMGDWIYGYAYDSIVAVDSIKLAICKDETLWWDTSFGFVPSTEPIWFYPDEVDTVDASFDHLADLPEIDPGVNVKGFDEVWFRYEWGAYDPGCYKVYALAWDDLSNQADTMMWTFAVDNMDPDYMEAYQPYYGQICTLYTWETEFHETLRVAVYDTTLGCLGWFNNIDSAQIALSTVISGEVNWWNGGTWDDHFTWLDLTPGDSIYDSVNNRMIYLWNLWLPVTALQNGTYNAEVQAWTRTGRYIHFYYNFVITGGLGYLTVNVIDPTPIFVGDSVRIEIAAHHTSGAIDTTFYYPIVLSSNYPDPSCLDLPTGSFYLERGCDTLWIHPACPGRGVIIWANSDASGYDPGNTFPFDVISTLDPEMFAELRDVVPDQGQQIVIAHTRSPKDPLYTGADIDTTTLKVTDYVYQMWVGGAWVDLTPDSVVEDAGTLYVYYTPGTFDPRSYRIEVDYTTNFNDPARDFDTLTYVDLGSIAPHDDIAPAAVADLRIAQDGAQVHLWWDEVTTGFDGSPEIDPENNIVYVVYRSVDNPYDISTFAVVDTVDVPEFYDALPTDPIATPTYYYVVAIDHDYNNSDASEIVGRTSYEFGSDWGQIAVPFDLDEYDPLMGSDLATYFGAAGITNISRWDNTAPGWTAVYVPPVVDEEIEEGADVLMAYGSTDAVLSLAGDLPASVPTFNYIAGRWNSVMVPLNRPDIRMASDLINAIGTANCSAVAHRHPGTGWSDMCVWTGSTFYGDFPVYPGQGYLMWAETDGSWSPAGAKSSAPAEIRHSENAVPADCGNMPKALYGDIEGAGDAVHMVITDKSGNVLLTDKSAGFWFRDGRFLIPLGKLHWNVGGEVIVRFYNDQGEVSDEAVVVLNDAPAQYAGKFFLKNSGSVPTAFALRGANPNPFNASTEIQFDLPVDAKVKVAVYDVAGKEIATLVDGELAAGTHTVRWDARDSDGNELPTGVYFCKMKSGDFVAVTKLILVK